MALFLFGKPSILSASATIVYFSAMYNSLPDSDHSMSWSAMPLNGCVSTSFSCSTPSVICGGTKIVPTSPTNAFNLPLSCPPMSSVNSFAFAFLLLTRRCSCIKYPISRLSARSSSCIPTARWVPRKEGEKRHSRGRIKIGKYLFHAYVVPPSRFWSNSIKPSFWSCFFATNSRLSYTRTSTR